MSILKNGNWGLKLIALLLAIIIYHALKSGTSRNPSTDNDRKFFQSN